MDYFSDAALHGSRVSLVPLRRNHIPDLAAAGADEAIWRWMPSWHHLPGTMADFVTAALELRKARRIVPFTTIDKATGTIVGSTRFHYVEPEHRRLEIGMTWIATAFQRSHVNSEAKLLQLWYAFEVLQCRRVEWKTDAENGKSRAAIARLGAREEGYFHKHMIYPDGRNRDSVYFAMTDDAWPAAKEKLTDRLGYPFQCSVEFEEPES